MGKEEFVQKLLKPLIMAADPTVTDVQYAINDFMVPRLMFETIEYVAVTYDDNNVAIVEVTNDNLIALTNHVLWRL